ncbi:hypothetical protein HPB51_005785 [Rhipicephalus microplus]|uniref:Uncharacterized protein n=1 Tax=Rhipicephalus microplus TaxID=6941 RepID=A0A9J6EMP0_RHIMP|nr:hypothetical protein HPB51_005785 [Rhipicephalus microplus]
MNHILAKRSESSRRLLARRLYVELNFDTAKPPAENRLEMTVDVCQEKDNDDKLPTLLGDVHRERINRAVHRHEEEGRRDRVKTATAWLDCHWPLRQEDERRGPLAAVNVLLRRGVRARDNGHGCAGLGPREREPGGELRLSGLFRGLRAQVETRLSVRRDWPGPYVHRTEPAAARQDPY